MWCVYFDVDECSSSTYIHTYSTRISEEDGGGIQDISMPQAQLLNLSTRQILHAEWWWSLDAGPVSLPRFCSVQALHSR